MKTRIDLCLVKQGFVESREKAKAWLMAGQVFVNGNKVEKAGTLVDETAIITIKENPIPYVSRGGLKLAKAIETFNLDCKDKIVMDIGASTGGFSDCALQNGACKVFAIDVGYGQLAWSLRCDPRVINFERTNVRNVTLATLGEQVDLITIDVAFISLTKIFPVLPPLLHSDGDIITLIKPQFEAGREAVGKKGVVRDPQVHLAVICNILKSAADYGFYSQGLTFSPVKGPEGNIEYLLHLRLDNHVCMSEKEQVAAVVCAAHNALEKA